LWNRKAGERGDKIRHDLAKHVDVAAHQPLRFVGVVPVSIALMMASCSLCDLPMRLAARSTYSCGRNNCGFRMRQ
jgi:hypothetical protein